MTGVQSVLFRSYEKFAKTGWTTELARQTNRQLMPLIIRAVVLGWLSAVWLAEEQRAR